MDGLLRMARGLEGLFTAVFSFLASGIMVMGI